LPTSAAPLESPIVTGGEQSAGLSIRHHVPEKDAVLARLRCREAVARPGKWLRHPLRAIRDQVGSYCPKWENFRLTSEVKPTFTEKLRQDPKEFSGRGDEVVRTDGWELVCRDGSWVCYRRSGKEPVVRGDSEAGSEAGLEKLSGAAK
jgi:phosphoglucomutase